MVGGTFLCSTCSASFESNSLRREHMREPWHVFNMQRKVAELPPISLTSYESLVGAPDLEKRVELPTKFASPSPKSKSAQSRQEIEYASSHDEIDSDNSDDDLLAEPERCLFCLAISETLNDCLEHMQHSHGFHIPRLEGLQTDIDTFLAYLNLVIARFHSCLYCAHEKHSADAVRSHMLSKGHCMLDLSEDSDFLDFWDDSDELEERSEPVSMQKLSENEIRLQSGSVATSRHDERPSVKPARPRRQQLDSTALVAASPPASSETPTSNDRPATKSKSTALTLSRRDQMSLTGLTSAQHHTLALTHKKLIAREQRFRNDARWTVEKFGNTTKMKHFKPDVPGRKNG